MRGRYRHTFRRLSILVAVALLGIIFGTLPAYAAVSYTPDGCILSMRIDGAIRIGSIVARSGTCDRDNVYRATVYDNVATNDGYCVRAVMQGIIMAVSCNASGTPFTFTDPDGDRTASTWVCLATSQQICGGPAGGNRNF
ncbi:hypothetical protein DMH04_13710 [Kibdelosporangium aridum]|uniref:Uncharacterized protein n=1 Tax=Kibdelosporangium aridum TaxID=2030 RepID=A0A428ZDV8_KIBAR|nr:hypothetical protein [Kibdelosporangium aridum]RSM86231.1 hypothetical protein DMH04_13710 [Kibdelosporangium aridum]